MDFTGPEGYDSSMMCLKVSYGKHDHSHHLISSDNPIIPTHKEKPNSHGLHQFLFWPVDCEKCLLFFLMLDTDCGGMKKIGPCIGMQYWGL